MRARRGRRNALWCATIQLAWDAASDALPHRRLRLGPPAPPAWVDALNRRTFPHEDLDEASTLVVGGRVADGVLDRLRTAFAARFPGEPVPRIDAGAEDAVGFAALRKELPFETPFRRLPMPMHFAGSEKPVTAFGMIQYDTAPDVKAMAGQVTVYLEPGDSPPHRGDDVPPVVELSPRGGADRILLSALAPGPTLETAWQALATRRATGRAEVLEDAEVLEIPRIRLDVVHRFEELIGAPIVDVAGGVLRDMRQSVRFSLDERGARVASDAVVIPALGLGVEMRFDRPFLLALMRRGASRPYLLLWVGNDDLLEGHVPPREATKAETAPFVGAWRLDVERTVEEQVERSLEAHPVSPDDEDAPGLDTLRADGRRYYGTILEGATVAFTVEPDGRTTFRMRLPAVDDGLGEDPTAPSAGETALSLAGRVVVVDGRPAFRMDVANGETLPEEERASLSLRRGEGAIRLNVPGLCTLVLVRSGGERSAGRR